MLRLNLRSLRRWRDEQIHLRSSAAFFGDLERDSQRVAECDGCKAREHLGVLLLVPVSRELVWRTDEDNAIGHRQRLGWLEPGFVGLLGQLLTSAIEEPGPSFVCSQRHDGRAGKPRRGSEARERMWKTQLRERL